MKTVILLVILSAISIKADAATIHLKNGRILSGTLENDSDGELQINLNGNSIKIGRDKIASIEDDKPTAPAKAIDEHKTPLDFKKLYKYMDDQDLTGFRLYLRKTDSSGLTPEELDELNWVRDYEYENEANVKEALAQRKDSTDEEWARSFEKKWIQPYRFNYEIREKYIEYLKSTHASDETAVLYVAEHTFLFPSKAADIQLHDALLRFVNIALAADQGHHAFLLMRLYAVVPDEITSKTLQQRLCLLALRDVSNGKVSIKHPFSKLIDGKTAALITGNNPNVSKDLKRTMLTELHAIYTDSEIKAMNLPSKQELDAYQEQQRLAVLQREQAEIQKQEEKENKYAAEQMAKGLIQFRGRWVTPEIKAYVEQNELEDRYIQKANAILMPRSKGPTRFKIIQAMDALALCRVGKYDSILGDVFYDGEFFALVGMQDSTVVDDQEFTSRLYWVGTYQYETVMGATKKINTYCCQLALAQKIVRSRFGLHPTSTNIGTNNQGQTASERDVGQNKTNNEIEFFSGSGFAITRDGVLVTNHHVVKNAVEIEVKTEKGLIPVQILATDPVHDVAILKCTGEFEPVSFSSEDSARLGQTAFTIGFPMIDIQGVAPKFTKGSINSLTGLEDAEFQYQIDLPVQPGNSGGPLADENGDIIGIVHARLNEVRLLKQEGHLPQNVNYAVKKKYILELAAGSHIQNVIVNNRPSKISFEKAVEKVKQSTLLLIVKKNI